MTTANLDLFGFESFDEIEGTPIMDMAASADQSKLKEFLRKQIHGNVGNQKLEVKLHHSDESTFSGEMEFSRATIDGEPSPAERRFCSRCGSALWVWDPRWPDLVHPFASAIDTPLPEPPEQVHIMLASKANWVRVDAGPGEGTYDDYPPRSLDAWHRDHGLLDET